MSRIRPFRPGDEPALAEICVRTADAGQDATGLLSDDAIWPAVFALPYAARHPDLAFVVTDDADRARGYVVGTLDTDAFGAWFRDEWWPPYAQRWPRPSGRVTREDEVLLIGYGQGAEPNAYPGFPAHLHIDLLPELQGQGWGRRLIAVLVERLRDAGVPGLHLVASAENAGAVAFYPRVGFAPLPASPSARAFGMTL